MNSLELCNQSLFNTIKKYTELQDEAIKELLETIPVEIIKKGTVILNQGDKPSLSYYLILGCVRQYMSNEDGKETTLNFYTDEQSINMFSYFDAEGYSLYSISCLEECMVVSCPESLSSNLELVEPEFRNMLQIFFQEQFIDLQKTLAKFKLSSPEERFLELVQSRPELLKKVPQHILANYLDITPETFSRFKKKLL